MIFGSPEVRFRSTVGIAVDLLAVVTAVAALSVATHLRPFGSDPSTYPRPVSAPSSLPFLAVILLGT